MIKQKRRIEMKESQRKRKKCTTAREMKLEWIYLKRFMKFIELRKAEIKKKLFSPKKKIYSDT